MSSSQERQNMFVQSQENIVMCLVALFALVFLPCVSYLLLRAFGSVGKCTQTSIK